MLYRRWLASTRINWADKVVQVEEKSDRILDGLSKACEQADAKVNATLDEAAQLRHRVTRILNRDGVDEKTRVANELVKERAPLRDTRPKETEPTEIEQEVSRDLV